MGVAHWKGDVAVEHETVTVEFERGRPSAINGMRFTTLIDAVLEANRVGGRHGLGMSDQIENRVIDAKSRGIYEAPGIALLHVAYERLLSSIHNENTLDLYFNLGRRLGRILYEGKWFDAEAMLIKDSLTRWLAPSVTGRVTLELRRGDDYSILDTQADYMAYAPEKLSMERVEDAAFAPADRIGGLEMQNLSITDNRAFLAHHLDAVAKLGGPPNPLPELLGKK
jgi:argininosuccinate synthase